MRTSMLLAIGAAALTAGCGLLGDDESRLAEPAAATPEAASQPWMLIRPPDNPAAVRMVELVRYLPGENDAFPTAKANGLPEAEREGSLALFRELRTKPSPRDRAIVLTDRLIEKGAPQSEWQHVRRFRSQDRCEETRKELQEVTREQSRKIEYTPGMLLNDLQFLWLKESFAVSHCVPLDEVAPAQTG